MHHFTENQLLWWLWPWQTVGPFFCLFLADRQCSYRSFSRRERIQEYEMEEWKSCNCYMRNKQAEESEEGRRVGGIRRKGDSTTAMRPLQCRIRGKRMEGLHTTWLQGTTQRRLVSLDRKGKIYWQDKFIERIYDLVTLYTEEINNIWYSLKGSQYFMKKYSVL